MERATAGESRKQMGANKRVRYEQGKPMTITLHRHEEEWPGLCTRPVGSRNPVAARLLRSRSQIERDIKDSRFLLFHRPL